MTKKLALYSFFIILLLGIAGLIFIKPENKNGIFQLNVYEVDSGWGYSITKESKPYIVQENIPAIETNKPFPDKESATKPGELVIEKLNEHKLPSVTKDEVEKILSEVKY